MEFMPVQKICKMNMLQRCCFFFSPFKDKDNFPTFENRWFFLECIGALYWDAERLMQNIQYVENNQLVGMLYMNKITKG
jgi:hypothetical protein